MIRSKQCWRGLVQDGLKVPYELKFPCDKKDIEAVNKLIKGTHAIKDASIKSTDEDKGNQPEKKLELESAVNIKKEPLDI